MRKLLNILPLFLLAVAFAAMRPAVATQDSTAKIEPASTSDSSMVAKGELQKVDTTNQTFTIKTPSGEAMQFAYDESTKVEGSNEGVQGLSSESGTQVTVHYKEESGRKLATSIEVNKSGSNQ